MTSIAQRHASQSAQAEEQEKGHVCMEGTSSDLSVELEDAASVMGATLMPTSRDDCPEAAALSQHTAAVTRTANRYRGKKQQAGPAVQTKEDRLARSCNHRRFRRGRTRASATGSNKPTALVDAEMEMGLARGSRLAEKAMHAVRQANAQVCLANLEVRYHGATCHHASCELPNRITGHHACDEDAEMP